jgi:hypothetical protein
MRAKFVPIEQARGPGIWSAGEAVAGAADQDCFGQAGQGGDGGAAVEVGRVAGVEGARELSFGGGDNGFGALSRPDRRYRRP